jgi:hypothetical protein
MGCQNRDDVLILCLQNWVVIWIYALIHHLTRTSWVSDTLCAFLWHGINRHIPAAKLKCGTSCRPSVVSCGNPLCTRLSRTASKLWLKWCASGKGWGNSFISTVCSWQRCVNGFVSALNCVINSSDAGKRVQSVDDTLGFLYQKCVRSLCSRVQLSHVLRKNKIGSYVYDYLLLSAGFF